MKKIFRFFKNYSWFSLAILISLVGLVLYIVNQRTIARIVISVFAIIEALPLLWDMWQDIQSGKYGIDILAVTAIVVSVILGQYWAAIVVVLMLTGGQSLEDYAEHKAQSELNALLKNAPVTAHVMRKNKIVKVPVDEIKIGERIIIKPGEVVPVDAVIIEGVSNFNEASLTGESLPQSKSKDDPILSGSINIDGAITARASAIANDSQYQQIIRLVKGAATSESPFIRLADRYSVPFTIAAYAIAVFVWITTRHAIRFLEVIIVATPCPLLLAAPIALISGMARSSKYGIIVKTGKALERLAETDVIAFDKTGTLTSGELAVKEIKAFNKFTNNEVLQLAASLEVSSNHVLANAVVEKAKKDNVKLIKIKNIKEISGLGVHADLKGNQVMIGNFNFMKQSDIKIPNSFKETSINQTAAYLASDGQLVGVITFIDEIRPEAKDTLKQLHDLGISDIVMITGDHKATAQLIAKQLSIDTVHAEALPADKLHILSQMKPRPIAFVGDGVNDSPALTSADIGIALGAKSSTAASESADMVIMLDDLSRVAVAVEIAQKTFKIARQSILIGIGLSLILMIVFATGKFPPLAGAIVQEVVDVFVIFNALRAHMIKPLVMNEQDSNK